MAVIPRKSLFLLLGGLFAWGIAIAIVLAAGLPERGQFSAVYFAPDARPVAAEIDAYAPPIMSQTFDGDTVELSVLRGRPVIINFWATWCGPCRDEMPALQTLRDETSSDQLEILGVNLGENAETIAGWKATYQLTFPLILDLDGRIAGDYRLRGQPTTVIVSPDGIITHIFYGPVTARMLREALNAA